VLDWLPTTACPGTVNGSGALPLADAAMEEVYMVEEPRAFIAEVGRGCCDDGSDAALGMFM